MIRVRKYTPKDLSAVLDIDLKAFEYPKSGKWFGNYVASGQLLCATYGARTIGYACLACDKVNRVATIGRIGVLPKYQGEGAGTALLRLLIGVAKSHGARKMLKTVPCINCCPGEPYDVSRWLRWKGFKATKVIPDVFYMYGDWVEGYLFEKGI